MATKPPYPDGSLSPPLTVTQRAAMIAWMEKNDPIWKNGGQGLGSGTYGPLTKQTDTNLIYLYDNAIETLPSSNPVTGTIKAGEQAAQNANPITTISGLIGKITSQSFWISAGEFIGGFLLIAIGTHAAVASAKSPNSKHTLSQSMKKVLPAPAKTVVKAKNFKGVRSISPQVKVSSSQANKALKQIAEYGKVAK